MPAAYPPDAAALAAKPRMKSFEIVVVTVFPVMVALVAVSVAVGTADGLNGFTVFAPETPKATPSPAAAPLVTVTVRVVDDSADVVVA